MLTLTNKQARQFILLKHGLLGAHKFIGKQGALEFVRQAGCIQFDPVDSCGKNAELTLSPVSKILPNRPCPNCFIRIEAWSIFPTKISPSFRPKTGPISSATVRLQRMAAGIFRNWKNWKSRR